MALCLGVGLIAGCGGDTPTSPTPSSPAPSSPASTNDAFFLRVDQGGSNRSGTNLSEPPWVSYSSCGQITNVSNQTATWTSEMTVYGPNGEPYTTEPRAGQVPRRFQPGGSSVGCGQTSVVDYDSTHVHAVSYRLRISYTLEDGTTGSIEGEAPIRQSEPHVTGIVINEFRPRGPRGDQDQFVELLNVSKAPIVMRGWFLQVSTRSYEVEVGTISGLGDEVTIPPGCSYLLTATTPPLSSTYGTYSGNVPGDARMRPLLEDAGGLALRTRSGQVVDQVGLGINTVFKEGTPLPPFDSANIDRSYARVGPDTGDNARDFRLESPSTPRNSASCR